VREQLLEPGIPNLYTLENIGQYEPTFAIDKPVSTQAIYFPDGWHHLSGPSCCQKRLSLLPMPKNWRHTSLRAPKTMGYMWYVQQLTMISPEYLHWFITSRYILVQLVPKHGLMTIHLVLLWVAFSTRRLCISMLRNLCSPCRLGFRMWGLVGRSGNSCLSWKSEVSRLEVIALSTSTESLKFWIQFVQLPWLDIWKPICV